MVVVQFTDSEKLNEMRMLNYYQGVSYISEEHIKNAERIRGK